MSSPTPDVKSIFGRALEIGSAAERAAYLDEVCGADPQLRAEVVSLLEEKEKMGNFLIGPAAPPGETVDHQPAEGPGARIGPYKLLQPIGEGGMGVVYMAEQEQPVRRKVALKLIKPGMDSAQVIARFEAERQALAMMDHLNIARVLDAGTTDTGRPYFVMELIHGVPITKYCDDNRLSVRERLELFVPVCQAIQHAHQKGVIHRDLKPSNVLVTHYDGRPVSKVIDFGVAKATEQRLTDRTMFTIYGAVVGTFEYMAPEQAEMSALGVDTRSDIYSLGVLLYELLTGTTPLDRKRLKEAAFTDIIRMIKEVEPSRPSAKLSTSGTLPAVAAARKIEPARLTKLVKGELDWIVMKCLEKDRTRRYETANALARDVQRYLADEPVEACPPSASYRLRRFARKYKEWVAVAAAFVTLLLVGVVISTWQAVRATRAEQQREKERDRSQLALTRQLAARVDADLQRLAKTGQTLAITVGLADDGEDKPLESWMSEVLKWEAEAYGLTLGFEPGEFKGKKEYCLYVYRTPEGIKRKDLHEDEKYKYQTLDWYTVPRREGRDLWGAPYFDDGGGDIWMVSYSARLRRNKKFVGVLTVDLPIEEYSRRVQGWLGELIEGQKSHGFIIDKKGNILSHPDYQAFLDKKSLPNIKDLPNSDKSFVSLIERILGETKPGQGKARDPETRKPAIFFFAPVPSAGWTFVTMIEDPEGSSSR